MTDQSTPHRNWGAAVGAALTRFGNRLAFLRPGLAAVGRAALVILRAVFRWVRRLGVVVAFLLPSAAIGLALASESWAPSTVDAAKAMWLSLSLILAGAAWLTIWICFKAGRALLHASFLGSSVGPRLLAAALVCTIYRHMLATTVWGLAWGVGRLGLTLPLTVARVAQRFAPAPQSEVAAKIMSQTAIAVPGEMKGTFASWVGETFLRTVDGELTEVGKGLQSRLAVHDIVVAIVTWLAIAFVFRTLASSAASRRLPDAVASVRSQIARGGRALASFLTGHPSINGRNLGFVAILAGGLFLSLAAITSLPRLREGSKPNNATSVEELRRELTGLQITKEQLATYYLDAELSDPLSHGGVPVPGSASGGDAASKEPIAAGTSSPPGDLKSPAASASGSPQSAVRPPSGLAAKSGSATKSREPSTEAPDKAGNGSAESKPDAKQGGAEISARQRLREAKAELKAAEEAAEKQRDVAENISYSDPEKVRDAWANVRKADQRVRTAREAVDSARESEELPREIAKERASLSSLWTEVTSRYGSLKEFVGSDEATAVLAASRAYGLQNMDRQGSHEERQDFLAIRDWYDDKVATHRDRLRSCSEQLHALRSELINWDASVRSIPTIAEDLDSVERLTRMPNWRADSIRISYTALLIACSNPVAVQMPAQASLGDSLGPLRFIAAWLLNPGSLPLALIVGLIGFGLLGASISTFVKERSQVAAGSAPSERRPEVIVHDLTGVLLRGLSAAIVVFLAVQGGLAVFSGNGSEPNPYVLLLACFVAAVFSESVWQSAYEGLRARLAGQSGGDRGRSGGGSSGVAAPRSGATPPPGESTANPAV